MNSNDQDPPSVKVTPGNRPAARDVPLGSPGELIPPGLAGGHGPPPSEGGPDVSVISQLGVDLTEVATARGIAGIDFWSKELTRLKEILGQRHHHAALLVGPEGVGKGALILALARAILDGNVPPNLLKRKIIELPFHRVLAGVRQVGDFERIVFMALREAAARDDVILFMSQLTSFMGVAGSQKGFFNASYAIEMACHQPGLYLLGSTTPELHRSALEAMPWCESILTKVDVPEPSRSATLELIRSSVEGLSEYHGVTIEEPAVEAAVDLSSYYIKERVLPGKAIELLDAAASKAGTSAAVSGEPSTLKVSHVTDALSDRVGIPADKLSKAGSQGLLGLEGALRRRIRGQDHCIRKLADVIRVTKLGLDARPVRPDGVFLFVGPTGVGKSELARALAEELYGNSSRLFVYNMTRYSDQDGLARLVGLKLGDLDHPGDLTESVARHPHSVVLLEQIERSHRDVAVMLMQIFRDGHIMDGHGSTVYFSNATIIMTSNSENIVPESNGEQAVGFGHVTRNRDARHLREVREAIEQFFPAEFMNGIDEVLVFSPLTDEVLREIVHVHLNDIRARLAQRSVSLDVTDAAVSEIVEKGHSREYGARNLGRTVEGLLLKPLARFLLANPSVRDVAARVVEGDIEVTERT